MFQTDLNAIEKSATRYQWIGLGLMVLAILTPIFSLTCWLKPEEESPAVWFQRSGAIMTIFSLVTGSGISSILNRLSPRGFTDLKIEIIKSRFQIRFEFIARASLWVAILGTIIWGYGDIFWKIAKEASDAMSSTSVTAEIFFNSSLVVTLIAVVYGLLRYFFVRENSEHRLNDIQWKKADYIWIIVGSLGLLIQATQIGASLSESSSKMEASFTSLYSQSLNEAAADLSDVIICFPPVELVSAETLKEFKLACEEFKKIRPSNATSIALDRKIALKYEKIDARKYTSPIIKGNIERFNLALQNHQEQVAVSGRAQEKINAYSRFFSDFNYLSLIFISLAIALRLAKVTGEICLKEHPPVENKKDL